MVEGVRDVDDAVPELDVVLVDDHALLREGTRQILERAGGFRVVAEAADGDEAVAVVEAHQPDVVLLDVRLPGQNGVEVARRIGTVAPATRVLMLSAFDEIDYVRAALSAGVAGYLLKTTPGDELVGAVRAACGGMTVLDPALSGYLLGQVGTDRSVDGFEALTSREREVVALVAEGLPNKTIAERLGISPRTVEGHLNHIFDKLGVSSRLALVRLAMKHGLMGE
jgi:NarL family two-component system response regulator LiaR